MSRDDDAREPDGLDDPRLDDPRLTAHALGEEAGPLTPEEQAEVDAIRATAETLKAGFAATPMPSLDQAHRNAILQGLSGTPQGLSLDAAQPHRGAVPGSAVRLADYSGLGALAATLLLVVGFGIAGATGGGGRGSGDFSNLYVKSFSAPNYAGVYFDSDVGLTLGGNITVGQAELGGSGSVAGGIQATTNHDIYVIGKGGSEIRSLGYAGGGGGGGPAPRGGRGKVVVGYGGRRDLADVTNGLNDGASTGHDNGGVGVSSNPSGKPSAGTFFNRGADGDYRGRIENILPVTGGADEENCELEIAQVDVVGDPRFRPIGDQDGTISGDDSATASYLAIIENPWIRPYGEAALSTFSIDVDTAGYSIVRRSLMEQNRLPPPGALRVEELVNYFPYSYPGPVTADPFAVHVDAAACPWAPAHRLVRIALKGREVEEAVRPAANLVFLLDVSGSMAQPNKLPLVQKSIAMLTERLTARDRVAMVVYAGQSGLVLPSTPAGDHAPILAALDRLGAGGSTNGGAGIELAYKVAQENFVPGGINRVVLATDGDFNVGVSDPSALVKMVEEKAKNGVFLTALGYGYDNLKDSTLEQLADKGNGNYGYVDTLAEARKVLVEQGMSTLHCIAKDVKIQVEFNPAKVAGYRLVGYENRMLAAQDFADDQKDAGEIGAGHTVTALYEVVPAGVEVPGAPVDELRYQRPGAFSGNAESLVVKLRWKEPEGTVSTPREFPFVDAGLPFDSGSDDFRFAAAVAAFGLVLRDSKCAGTANLDMVREIAAGALGADAGGWRAEFVTLVEKAKTLKR